MMDPREVNCMRNMWIAALSLYASEQVRIFHAAMNGRQSVPLSGQRRAVSSLDNEIASARRYLRGRDFAELCDLADVRFDAEAALAGMLETARKFDGADFSRKWMKQLMLSA